MAVIVQEQVSGPGVAGVAFSRDPNTGDPGKITIAASYGLEKAVSLTINHMRNYVAVGEGASPYIRHS